VRVALITGGGRGIGAAVAMRLAVGGAVVTVLDRDRDAAERIADAIGEQGGNAEAIEADVSDVDAVAAAVAGVVERRGRLDYACNSAGVTGIEAQLTDYPERVFRRVLDVNATGVYACMQAELAVMVRQGSGSIVNIGSGASALGVAGHAAYVASKHAVAGLTRTAAIEVAGRNVQVNAVAPGLVGTGMAAGIDEAAFAAEHPIGRASSANEIAEVVAWLLESAPAALTGAIIPVDGGLAAKVAGLG
jgi:NAD(P)-dependent dehydrogenase (short-subunit alcohol dehydrogenase family)